MNHADRLKEIERRAAAGEPLFDGFYEYIPPRRQRHVENRIDARWYDFTGDSGSSCGFLMADGAPPVSPDF